MSADAFHTLIQIEPSTANKVESYENDMVLPAPERAFPRTYHSVPETQKNSIELIDIKSSSKNHDPLPSPTATPAELPLLRSDLEMSRPASPVEDSEAFGALQSFANPPMNRFRMLSACFITFAMGISDSAPGALIPYIER